MPPRDAPRLRHLSIRVPRLAPAVELLRTAFGLEVACRGPLLGTSRGERALLPLGTSFLELCAPLHADTAAVRGLAPPPQGGGCTVALECEDLQRRVRRLGGLGIRVVTDLAAPGYRALRMHPRDTGACRLEFNCTESGGEPLGPYAPAGPDWQQAIRRDWVEGLAAVEVRARAPERLAAHWSRIVEAPLRRSAQGAPELALGPALRFTAAGDDEAEGVAAVELASPDPQAALARARAQGAAHGTRPQSVCMLGVDFCLVRAA